MSDSQQVPEFSLPTDPHVVPVPPQVSKNSPTWPFPIWGWGLVLVALVLFAWNGVDQVVEIVRVVREIPEKIREETERNNQQQGDYPMSERVIEVKSRSEFDEATKTGVVLVDFYAPWCGPCRMQSPILHKLADELGDKVKILKVNTDELQELGSAYKVSSIPMLLLFKDGAVHKQYVGLQQESVLRDAIEAAQ
ncbi:MAG: thioredoxin [Thermoguttaceae bacterium]